MIPPKRMGHPRWLSDKESAYQCRRCKRQEFDPCIGKFPWHRKWQPIPVFLPGKSNARRNPAGYCPWGHKESDTTEHTRKAPRKKGRNSGKSQRNPSQAAPKTHSRASVRRHGKWAKSFTSKNKMTKGLAFREKCGTMVGR